MQAWLRSLILIAVLCVFGMVALPQPALAAKPVPGEYSMSLSATTVDFGAIDPEIPTPVNNAVRLTVNGYDAGTSTLEVSYTATDFVATAGGVPDIPVSNMTYSISKGVVDQPFASSGTIATEVPAKLNWRYRYTFSYTLTVPFEYEAGPYSASIVYTAVLW